MRQLSEPIYKVGCCSGSKQGQEGILVITEKWVKIWSVRPIPLALERAKTPRNQVSCLSEVRISESVPSREQRTEANRRDVDLTRWVNSSDYIVRFSKILCKLTRCATDEMYIVRFTRQLNWRYVKQTRWVRQIFSSDFKIFHANWRCKTDDMWCRQIDSSVWHVEIKSVSAWIWARISRWDPIQLV